MSTVIYLANQQLQVVIGNAKERKITIEKCYEATAPEGSIINGMIMDSELFIEFMKDFWSQNKLPKKDVILVIDSRRFVGKIIEMPELSVKKANAYIAREFSDSNRNENCLYSFLPLGKGEGKKRRVYAESVEPDFIKDYLDIFSEIGITIKSILSGESSLIGLTSMTIGKQFQTFLMVIADTNILTTVLWINGSFNYFNSTRCFHEKGSVEYAEDIARCVSQTRQFMQAQQIEQTLEQIVIAGIAWDELPLCQKTVAQMGIDTAVSIFDTKLLTVSINADIQKHLKPISGLIVKGNSINFLHRYKENKNAGDKKKKELGVNLLPVFLAAVCMILLFLSCFTVKTLKQTKLDEMNDYNTRPDVIMSVTEYDMLLLRNQYLSSQNKAISDMQNNIQTYPVGNSRVMEQIMLCAKDLASVSFSSFQAEQGTLHMTASSKSVEEINCFIKKLCEQDIFYEVDYSGYTLNEQNACWDIHVTCTLAESAGR